VLTADAKARVLRGSNGGMRRCTKGSGRMPKLPKCDC